MKDHKLHWMLVNIPWKGPNLLIKPLERRQERVEKCKTRLLCFVHFGGAIKVDEKNEKIFNLALMWSVVSCILIPITELRRVIPMIVPNILKSSSFNLGNKYIHQKYIAI